MFDLTIATWLAGITMFLLLSLLQFKSRSALFAYSVAAILMAFGLIIKDFLGICSVMAGEFVVVFYEMWQGKKKSTNCLGHWGTLVTLFFPLAYVLCENSNAHFIDHRFTISLLGMFLFCRLLAWPVTGAIENISEDVNRRLVFFLRFWSTGIVLLIVNAVNLPELLPYVLSLFVLSAIRGSVATLIFSSWFILSSQNQMFLLLAPGLFILAWGRGRWVVVSLLVLLAAFLSVKLPMNWMSPASVMLVLLGYGFGVGIAHAQKDKAIEIILGLFSGALMIVAFVFYNYEKVLVLLRQPAMWNVFCVLAALGLCLVTAVIYSRKKWLKMSTFNLFDYVSLKLETSTIVELPKLETIAKESHGQKIAQAFGETGQYLLWLLLVTLVLALGHVVI